MARNSSGTMSAPGSYPPVADTVISLDDYKALVSDIIAELTDSLSRSGKGGLLAALKLADGTQALPGLSFNSEAGTGLYRYGAGDLRAAVQGALIAKLTSVGLDVTGTLSGTTVSAPAVKGDAFAPRSAAVPVALKGDGAKLVSVRDNADAEKAYFDSTGKLFVAGVEQGIGPQRADSATIHSGGYSFHGTVKDYIRVNGGSGAVAVATLTARGGHPVLVQLQPASSAMSYIGLTGSGGTQYLEIEMLREGPSPATLMTTRLNVGVPGIAPGVISFLDNPPAGAHNYVLKWVLSAGGMGAAIDNSKLVAVEF